MKGYHGEDNISHVYSEICNSDCITYVIFLVLWFNKELYCALVQSYLNC